MCYVQIKDSLKLIKLLSIFLNTVEQFKEYILKTAEEYNNPVQVRYNGIEEKEEWNIMSKIKKNTV